MNIEKLSDKVKAALDGIADEFASEQAREKTDGEKIAAGLASIIDRTIANKLKSAKSQKEEKKSAKLKEELDVARSYIKELLNKNEKLTEKINVAKNIQNNIVFHMRDLMEDKLSRMGRDFLIIKDIAECINETQSAINKGMVTDSTSILNQSSLLSRR